jgi:hypothetical protein
LALRVYGDREAPGRLLRTQQSDDSEIRVEVVDDGRPVGGTTLNVGAIRSENAWCGDLNGDRVLDFILPVWSGGNGIGAEFATLVVVLSSRVTYRTWTVPTVDPDPEDLLALPSRRECVIVKSSLRDPRHEDQLHSYWIYNLLSIRKDELVVANGLDWRFPKWVWFTTGPNHKPAASLSRADKQRIWASQHEAMFEEVRPTSR